MTSGERMIWAAEFVRMMDHERLDALAKKGIDLEEASRNAVNHAALLVGHLRQVGKDAIPTGFITDAIEMLEDMLGART